LSTKPGSSPQQKKPESSSSSDSDSDSDSEKETTPLDSAIPIGKRGNSEFWFRKMRTHHSVLDINKDGTVSWHDFEYLAKRFIILGKLQPAQEAEFLDALREFWEETWGASHDEYAFIMPEGLVTNLRHVINTPDLRKKAGTNALRQMFNAVDHDHSGEISVEEYKLFYRCLGLSNENAIESFAVIDNNGDGILSCEEFVALGRMFFLTEDETHPSRLFWGPLMD